MKFRVAYWSLYGNLPFVLVAQFLVDEHRQAAVQEHLQDFEGFQVV